MKKDIMRLYTCCFFGHRKVNVTEELISSLEETIEKLIAEEKVTVFLFGSKSEFDDLCLNVVTTLKEKYPHIKRVYVRAEFPYINDDYKAYLLEQYEDTYYPERLLNAGRAVYVERNYEMIDNSTYCVAYYDAQYSPERKRRRNSNQNRMDYQPKSGTRLAYEYAVKKRLKIVNTKTWINVNKVDSKKRKNYTDISNASFWLGVRPLLCE